MEPTPPASPHSSIATHFSSLRDPRVVGRSAHELLDILTIAILAVICGSKGWEDIEDWATDHVAWLRTFLRLRNGIPQHDCTYQAAGLPGCGLPRSSAERGSPRRRASAGSRAGHAMPPSGCSPGYSSCAPPSASWGGLQERRADARSVLGRRGAFGRSYGERDGWRRDGCEMGARSARHPTEVAARGGGPRWLAASP